MMEQLTRCMDEEELAFAVKIGRRSDPSLAWPPRFQNAKIVVIQNPPWTFVSLIGERNMGVGFSKQMRYRPHADVWDAEVGKRIALARAVRGYLAPSWTAE